VGACRLPRRFWRPFCVFTSSHRERANADPVVVATEGSSKIASPFAVGYSAQRVSMRTLIGQIVSARCSKFPKARPNASAGWVRGYAYDARALRCFCSCTKPGWPAGSKYAQCTASSHRRYQK